jgi:uncharacterized protein
MQHALRIVLDTNVLVSALISSKQSYPAQILQDIKKGLLSLLVTPNILDEYFDVLNRPYFETRIASAGYIIGAYLSSLVEKSILVKDATIESPLSRDPKDDVFLMCAVSGEADYIVSGDDDLLSLEVFQGIKIVSAKMLVEILESQ